MFLKNRSATHVRGCSIIDYRVGTGVVDPTTGLIGDVALPVDKAQELMTQLPVDITREQIIESGILQNHNTIVHDVTSGIDASLSNLEDIQAAIGDFAIDVHSSIADATANTVDATDSQSANPE